jgi:hypothetical protein
MNGPGYLLTLTRSLVIEAKGLGVSVEVGGNPAMELPGIVERFGHLASKKQVSDVRIV